MDAALSPIQKPELLDAGRAKTDEREEMSAEEHRDRAQLLADALDESCAYAEQLWDTLDQARRYLYTSLPPEPHDGTVVDRVGAAPTGPDDEKGWQAWVDVFAAVASTLCGPHGDAGYGLSTAREAARLRRAGPPPVLVGPARPEQPEPSAPDAPNASAPSPQSLARVAGLAALAVLALRGLRPSRRGAAT